MLPLLLIGKERKKKRRGKGEMARGLFSSREDMPYWLCCAKIFLAVGCN
jgi:hypothetical protein